MEMDWNARYQTHDAPWDSGHPSHELVRVLDEYRIAPTRMFEAGCGTGTNCVHLAQHGFEVTGADIAPAAIDLAQQRATDARVQCEFIAADVLQLPVLGPPFGFLFDRGCYHTLREQHETAVVDIYDRLLVPGGWMLVLTGNANETAQEEGPPRVSEEQLRHAFGSRFHIQHLRDFRFETNRPEFQPLAWSLLLRKS